MSTLTPNEQMQLIKETEIARKAAEAVEMYFGDFFKEKEALLVDAFRTSAIGDEQNLVRIQMMFKALDALKSDLVTKIETGRMAEMQLESAEKETVQ